MNRAELTVELADKCCMTQVQIRRVLDALDKTVAATLADGYRVQLPGIGYLAPVVAQARPGRNPRTGEVAQIPARVRVKFTPTLKLKGRINGTS